MPSCLFLTGSMTLSASRFFCEHLHQNLFWACISRIHAQVPLVTSGKLTEAFHQQIPCGIDVSVMVYPAFRARPVPHIQPQLIENVPALRAGLARGIPAIRVILRMVYFNSPRAAAQYSRQAAGHRSA
jgi:hypothetical protein